MAFITGLVTVVTIGVSCYALYHSGQSIPKLQKYEAKAQKAAEWSSVAEKRLWDTRYTVAAGFVTTTASLISSLYFLLFVPSGFGIQRVGWAAVLCGAERFSSMYMHDFWRDKAKIPMMDDYNDAISNCQNVVGLSDVLSVCWGLVAAFKALGM